MARTPRPLAEPIGDAFDIAADINVEKEAADFGDILSALQGVTDGQSKVIVYKIQVRGGKWAICKELYPPIDTSNLFEDLKREYGPGEYKLRIFAGGRIRNTLSMNIEAGKSDEIQRAPATGMGGDMGQMFLAMMQMQQASADRQMQMIQAAQQQQAQQQQANQTAMLTLAGIVAPLLLGNRDTPASLIGAIAPLMARNNDGGLKDMLPLMAAAKELFGGGDGGGDDSLLGSAAKSLLPMLAGAMSQPAPVPTQVPYPGPQYERPQYIPPVVAPVQHPVITSASPSPLVSSNPIVSAIGADLLFYAERDFDPELAGDNIIETLLKKGVEYDALLGFAVQLQSTGNWVDALKSWGLDISGREQWFNSVLTHVAQNYPRSDDPVGGSGGEADAKDNGEPGA